MLYEVITSSELGLNSKNLLGYILDNNLSKTFFFDDYKLGNYFWKQFLSGAFIAIVMTGLDQDNMQKNLTCKSLKDAQKNMFWFTIVLTIVVITSYSIHYTKLYDYVY